MIRELQPLIVINDRLPGGDYDTPEQFVPPTAPVRPWEVCLTMNESWGYNPSDTGYKSERELVHAVRDCGKGWASVAEPQSPGRRDTSAGAGRAGAGGRRLAGPKRRGDLRDRTRPRAVAILRADHAVGRDGVSAPVDAAV